MVGDHVTFCCRITRSRLPLHVSTAAPLPRPPHPLLPIRPQRPNHGVRQASNAHLHRAARGPSRPLHPLDPTTAGRTSRHHAAPETGLDGKQHSGMLRRLGYNRCTSRLAPLCGTCASNGANNTGVVSCRAAALGGRLASDGMQVSQHCWARAATDEITSFQSPNNSGEAPTSCLRSIMRIWSRLLMVGLRSEDGHTQPCESTSAAVRPLGKRSGCIAWPASLQHTSLQVNLV